MGASSSVTGPGTRNRLDVRAVLEPVNGRDIRVIVGGRCPGFALEARQSISVAGKRLREDLDRDFAIQLISACSIDLAHAAGAQRSNYLVDANFACPASSPALLLA
jgi:hypothetical protein